MKRSGARSRKRTTEHDRRRLLAALADGEFHSGQQIALDLGVSRSAVWKHLEWLRARGVPVEAVPRRGYRLLRRTEMLSEEIIVSAMSSSARHRIERLDVLLETDSTNRYLGAAAPPTPGRAHACLTEIQTAGRGRRGRIWLAPFGSGLCLSVGWLFPEMPGTFPALGLAIGVAVASALENLGAPTIGLKWPNDLVVGSGKLGGILIEVRGESDGGTHVIVGVGINLRLPPATRLELAEHHGISVTDLHTIAGRNPPGRNRIAAAVLQEVVAALQEFDRAGFEPFRRAWHGRDVMRDSVVRLSSPAGEVRGVARGVAPDGALLLERSGRLERHMSGEISLRSERAS